MSINLSDCIGNSLKYLIEENRRIKRVYKTDNDGVILGRKFQLGSRFQYELARDLFQKTNYTVLVDYPISYRNKSKSKTLYPDILVLKKGKLKGIIEVKIDLGYLRFKHFGMKYNKRTKEYTYKITRNKFKQNYDDLLSSRKFSYKYKQNEKDEKRFVDIPQKIVKIMILVTKHNDHGRYDYFEKSMKDSGFVLLNILEKKHPNRDDCKFPDIVDKIRKNQEYYNEAFKGLF